MELSRSSSGVFQDVSAQSDTLLASLVPHIQEKTTKIHELIDPEQQLAVFEVETHTETLSLPLSNNPLNNLNGCKKRRKPNLFWKKKEKMDKSFGVNV